MVILAGYRKLKNMEVTVRQVKIRSREDIKYLGVWLNQNLRMTMHIKETVMKAGRCTDSLAKLMPSLDGNQKRRMLVNVMHSIMLYVAPMWERTVRYERYRKMLESVQRQTALRVTAAYRTVSTDALLVIAGIPPTTLLIEERSRLYYNKELTKAEARDDTVRKW